MVPSGEWRANRRVETKDEDSRRRVRGGGPTFGRPERPTSSGRTGLKRTLSSYRTKDENVPKGNSSTRHLILAHWVLNS